MVSDPPHLMESVSKRQCFFVSLRTSPCPVGEALRAPSDKNARIACSERRTCQIGPGERDVDGGTRIAGVRGKGRDRRRADATRTARDGEEIPDGIIRGDIALPVDHLREPPQVVVDILGLVGDRHNRADE